MKTIKRLNDSADFLLLDVPCTGSGVLRRNPDAKYRIDRKMLERVSQTQQEILVNYSKMLKSGGTLVYATCSLIADENERQVQAFLENHVKAFSLVEQKTIYPSNHNSDGFYMAKLRKA
jgi:16S rRNA (cytosine967-C5)-methyltransferase